MSVTRQYTAEKFLPDGREYTFTFESIGSAAFEFWFDDGAGTLTKIPSNRYSVDFTGPRPLFEGGVVTLDADPDPSVFQYLAIRNTPIDQTVDYQQFARFPEVIAEFTLDKLTMICQELNDRLCDLDPDYVPVTPITQEIEWLSYDRFPANYINFALDKITQICVELDANKCDRPDLP